METQSKIKTTYTKDDLIRIVSRTIERDTNLVKSAYNALEKSVFQLLASADKTNDISVRLFEGISLDSKFIPEKTKINNLTGKIIITSSKIKPNVNITRSYINKLTNYNN